MGRPIGPGWWRSVIQSIRRTRGAATRGPRWRPCSSALLANRRCAPVRVTSGPDNVASYQLASQYGFAEVGHQWDDEDSLEIIYEVDARHQ